MKTLCVFCGSAYGKNPAYRQHTEQLGRLMVEQGYSLVYGGGKVGLMGAIADSVLAHGGQVTGFMPRFLVDREIAHTGLTQLHVVDSMHERKAAMAELSDAFITLPGGLGTLEELFEIYTWGQLGLHNKPFGLLNTHGYYDSLITFLDQSVQEGFVQAEMRQLIVKASEPEALLSALKDFTPPVHAKWTKPPGELAQEIKDIM